MGRKSLKNERQKEIIRAFYKVTKKEGIENASIAKVADILDMNPSLIIHYFKTKEDLLNSLADFILERYLSIYKIDGEIDSKEKLIQLIDNLFSRKWNRLFDDGVFYSCYALTYRNAEFKDRFRNLHVSLRKSLCNILTEANSNLMLEITDVEQTVELVFSILEGAYYYLGMVDNKLEYNEKANWYKQHVFKFLNLS